MGDNTWCLLSHLSGLVGYLGNGIGGVIAPLIIYLVKKDTSPPDCFACQGGAELQHLGRHLRIGPGAPHDRHLRHWCSHRRAWTDRPGNLSSRLRHHCGHQSQRRDFLPLPAHSPIGEVGRICWKFPRRA